MEQWRRLPDMSRHSAFPCILTARINIRLAPLAGAQQITLNLLLRPRLRLPQRLGEQLAVGASRLIWRCLRLAVLARRSRLSPLVIHGNKYDNLTIKYSEQQITQILSAKIFDPNIKYIENKIKWKYC